MFSYEVLRVSIPLSLYREAVVPDISTLYSRLQHSGALPAPWICSVVSWTSIVLSKFRYFTNKLIFQVLHREKQPRNLE